MFLCLALSALAEQPQFVHGRILVKAKPGVSDSELLADFQAYGAQRHHILPHSRVHVLSVAEEHATEALASLNRDARIEFAERDYIAHAYNMVNDPFVLSGNEWHLTRIQAFQAWDITQGSSNVTIAVLDSGVNAAHPDLSGRLLPGYDFVNNDNNPADDFGHGTAVTGTAVAAGNNGVGVAGVAYGCTVLPVKVMDASGSASHSTIAQGIEYAVQAGARIINLSLGGDWSSSTLQDAIDYAWSSNVIVVAAAGNNGSTVPQYPAACNHVVAVGASEPDDSRAWFSSYGSFVTLFAPGDTIWTTQRDLNNPYAAWSGTSFSSPVVAGVAGLVLSLNPSLSNAQVVNLLTQTADDLGAPGFDATYSFGRVNALRAVSAVSPLPGDGSSPPQSVPTSPPAVALLNPLPGMQVSFGATVPIAASASAATGTVFAIEFYANDLQIATLTAAPFTFDWTPQQSGTYELTAVAIDEQGLRGTSAPVSLVISGAQLRPPTIHILGGPSNGSRLASPGVSFAGVAGGNNGIDHVEYQLNGGPAQLASGTTNWSVDITLDAGPNVLQFRSVDVTGNSSPQITRSLTYVVLMPISISTNGLGTVVPALDGTLLEIGRTYRVRAVPSAGQLFAGWTGGAQSSAAVLTFTMQTNLSLQANFVQNPFPAVRGNYAGLVANPVAVTPDNSGAFGLTVSPMGVFSGRLLSAGHRYGFSGRLNLGGDATVTIRRGLQTPLALALHVDLTNQSDQAIGQITDGNWTSDVNADRNVFNARFNPAQQAGLRSFVLQRTPDDSTAGGGNSRISLSGGTAVHGNLSDGRAFATASTLAKNGDCPFYLSFNHGAEVVIGWLNFPADQGPTASGTVVWVQTGTNAFASTLRAVPGQ